MPKSIEKSQEKVASGSGLSKIAAAINLYDPIFKIYTGGVPIFVRLQQIFLKTRALAPIRATIVLTHKCNCDCRMCYIPDISCDNELTFEDLKNTLDQLPKGSMVIITGGEPTLAKDFFKIVDYAAKGHKVQVRTNGSTLDKEMIKKLIDAGIWVISFSIEAPHDEIHDQIRGNKGLLQKVKRSIDEIVSMKRDRRLARPFIHINTVIMKESIPYLPEMVEFGSKSGVDFMSFSPDSRTDSYKNFNEQDLDYLKERLEKSLELAKRYRLCLRFGNNLSIEDILEFFSAPNKEKNIFERKFICGAPWAGVFIMPDGNVKACYLPSATALGNIKKDNIRNIWNNKIARDLRESIMKTNHFRRECISCCMSFKSRSGAYKKI